jgi:4-oxalocrotonate tautomerase
MPAAYIDGPRITDIETKRTLVKEVTDAMEKAYKLPRQAFVVTLTENPPENIGVGGKLISDK